MVFLKIQKLIIAIGLIFIVCLIIKSFINYRKESNKIYLKLSNKGITLKDKTFVSWSQIQKTEFQNKNIHASSIINDEYLIINTSSRKIEVYINELNIGTQELNYLLKIYRKRSSEN